MIYGNTGQYNDGKILDQHGRPWQEQHGYDPKFAVPHVLSFMSLIGSSYRTYFHGGQDDAIRYDPEFAEAMRRDPELMALIQERKMSTVSLTWSIKVPNDRDPVEKAVKDNLTAVINATPRKKQLFNYLMEAIWPGKYASQVAYRWEDMTIADVRNPKSKIRKRVPVMAKHEPVDGDKIGYGYDGTPYLLVSGAFATEVPQAELILTNVNRGIRLGGTWRRRFIIHQHEIIDAPFMDGMRAASIYGVGIRHYLYWLAWLKKELLANILEYCERTGLGLRVWYYQAGNQKSFEEVKKAAREQTDRTNVLVPRFQNQAGRSAEGVEFVDAGTQGANLLLEILKNFTAQMERYVVGQTLSAGTEGSGLGGTGVAALHAATKHKLIAFDAENLAETLTMDWVRPLHGWMHPELTDIPISFEFNVNVPDTAALLSAAASAYSMGAELKADWVMSVLGAPTPEDGDKVLSQIGLMQKQQELEIQGQQQMQPQLPGGDAEPAEQDFQELIDHLMSEPGDGQGEAELAGPQQFWAREQPLRYAELAWDGPHVGPKGKTYWINKQNPNDIKYGQMNPNIAGNGQPSPREVAGQMAPALKTQEAQPSATGQPQQQSQQTPAAPVVHPDAVKQMASDVVSKIGDGQAAREALAHVTGELKAHAHADPKAARLLKAAEMIGQHLTSFGSARDDTKPPKIDEPTQADQPIATTEDAINLYQRLSQEKLSVQEVRSLFSPLAKAHKSVLAGLASHLGYRSNRSRKELADKLLETLEGLAISQVRRDIIGGSAVSHVAERTKYAAGETDTPKELGGGKKPAHAPKVPAPKLGSNEAALERLSPGQQTPNRIAPIGAKTSGSPTGQPSTAPLPTTGKTPWWHQPKGAIGRAAAAMGQPANTPSPFSPSVNVPMLGSHPEVPPSMKTPRDLRPGSREFDHAKYIDVTGRGKMPKRRFQLQVPLDEAFVQARQSLLDSDMDDDDRTIELDDLKQLFQAGNERLFVKHLYNTLPAGDFGKLVETLHDDEKTATAPATAEPRRSTARHYEREPENEWIDLE